MKPRTVREPNLRKRLLLALVVMVAAGPFLRAQTSLRFDVASVRPAPPGIVNGSMNGGPIGRGPFNQSGDDPGRIMWTNVRLLRVIQVAYDFRVDRISGPDWLGKDGYNIVATIPMGTSVADFRLMIQSLLAERFQLTLHRETKEGSGYALVIAKNGPKIKESTNISVETAATPEAKRDKPLTRDEIMMVDQSGFPAPRPGNAMYPPGALFEATIPVNGMYRSTGLNERMPLIAELMGRFLDAPVEDETGLTGKYDFHLEFLPNSSGAAAGDGADPPAVPLAADPRPGLFDAVQSQLGLRLVSKKVPVDVLVVDHIEKMPTDN